ncbi:MAG: hypothetical protein LBU23_01485 [Planctomycetota bacterium]|jgi:hypothetical protein|nr:hypothetical protein [Planctomycetota bacterium]
MSVVMEESQTLEVIFAEPPAGAPGEMELFRIDVMAANWEASKADAENLAAFLELVCGADPEYLDAGNYPPPAESTGGTLLDWETVSQALSESQNILVGVQELLAGTLAALGVEDSRFIRVCADPDGRLRLTSGHPRQAEIEAVLNRPENRQLRELHAAALAGMSLAGSLVGGAAVPPAVLESLRAKAGMTAA